MLHGMPLPELLGALMFMSLATRSLRVRRPGALRPAPRKMRLRERVWVYLLVGSSSRQVVMPQAEAKLAKAAKTPGGSQNLDG